MLTVLEFSLGNSVGWTPAVFLYMRRIDGLDIATDHSDMALDMLMKNTKTRLQFTDCDTNE